MYKIEELINNSFFRFFKEISDIPRESGNEKEISDYLVKFAKDRNLEVIQDEYLNVVIKKKATKGYDHIPAVILQGHMDMVCVKIKESNHNFEKDPLCLQIKGDMIYATDTTLGSDDGVAVAYSLSILDSDNLKHPALEVVMTTEEETTMSGAMNLDTSILDGKIMINLDSNRDDELLVSSTGGINTISSIDIEWIDTPDNYFPYEICVTGLIGGHSGEEIHKERGNANKIIARILDNIKSKYDIHIANILGGTSSNAIAREANAVIYIKGDDSNVIGLVNKISNKIKDELMISDKDLSISIKSINKKIDKVFSKNTSSKLIDLLVLIPNGVQSMSLSVEGLVESSNNLGTIRTNKEKIDVECETRSCVKSKMKEIQCKIEKISKLLNFKYLVRNPYPEWNYNSNSMIQNVFKDSYKELLGDDVKIQAVHAGLETGVFIEKMPYLDIISYGPNAYELHNPKEHMNITSCFKTWDVLAKTLENTIDYY